MEIYLEAPQALCASQTRRVNQLGMTLVEVLVAIVIGLFILAGLVTMFANTSTVRARFDRSAEQFENGRYALTVLGNDMKLAGYYGTYDKNETTLTTDLPCSTTVSEWNTSISIFAHGSNQNELVSSPTVMSCLTDRKTNTDAIFIQRSATCVSGTGTCTTLANGAPGIQVSECGTEYSTTPFKIALQASTTPFGLLQKDCGTASPAVFAPVRRYIRRIFYVNNNDQLVYVDIGSSVGAAQIVSSNVENMQIEYGFDTDSDGTPDTFSSTLPVGVVWNQAIGARIWLLVRDSQTTPAYTDTKSYTIGDVTISTPSPAGYQRHVYSSYVTFINPQGRKE